MEVTMKRLASQLSLILAALAATPVALAGSDILKCVDGKGRVTLTDQPCEGGARSERMMAASALNTAGDSMLGSSDGGSTGSGGDEPQSTVIVQRYAAHPSMERQHDWRPRVPKRERPLARDVETLKAARAQMLLSESERQPRPQLATLQ
jgi:hypothetical protein